MEDLEGLEKMGFVARLSAPTGSTEGICYRFEQSMMRQCAYDMLLFNTTTNAENEQAMKENDKQRKDLDKDVSLSQQVYATESDVAEELRKLCSLGVFPKAELQLMTIDGNVTTIHHNCTNGNSSDYGLHAFDSSSSIHLASSLTIETISKNNGGGGNHDGEVTFPQLVLKVLVYLSTTVMRVKERPPQQWQYHRMVK